MPPRSARPRRGRHRRPAPPVPFVRAAFGALVLAVIVGGVPAAGPAGIVPGSVPLVADPAPEAAAFSADRAAEVAASAVGAALAQLGTPYEWGGDGPAAGDTGFDCSGLTHHAYAVAGVAIPRTAHTQYYAGPGVPDGMPLQSGDLVFYGVPERVYHVGLYLGDGTMVNAPRRGEPVQVARYRYHGDEYLGATRPAALGDPALLPPRPAPAPAPVPVPESFDAPPAALPDGLRDQVEGAQPTESSAAAGRAPAPAPAAAVAALLPVDVPAAPVELPAEAPVDVAAAAAVLRAAPPVAAFGALRAPADQEEQDQEEQDPDTTVATRDHLVALGPVNADPDGLPPSVGRVGTLLRVPVEVVDGLQVGDTVEVTATDDDTSDVTDDLQVLERRILDAEEAGDTDGPALLAPTTDGRWTVLLLG
ncbi:C40 family peptidase [Pseudonocardia oceani]|uniref:C40 family peptidase n=1 Tax=Pseudonocardia oceani TaxID=2792013 RepID=A0ABS6U4C6_9PSEU|nr:C40 family peptidase [Pseudonocardia oceani]